jgi:acyl carrier protein
MEMCNESIHLPPIEEIQQWMVNYVAELLDVSCLEVKTDVPFDRYGFNSLVTVGMAGDLEEWLGLKLDPTLVYDYPTIDALSAHLSASVLISKL